MGSGLLNPGPAGVRAPLRSPLGAVPGLSLGSLLVSSWGGGEAGGWESRRDPPLLVRLSLTKWLCQLCGLEVRTLKRVPVPRPFILSFASSVVGEERVAVLLFWALLPDGASSSL